MSFWSDLRSETHNLSGSITGIVWWVNVHTHRIAYASSRPHLKHVAHGAPWSLPRTTDSDSKDPVRIGPGSPLLEGLWLPPGVSLIVDRPAAGFEREWRWERGMQTQKCKLFLWDTWAFWINRAHHPLMWTEWVCPVWGLRGNRLETWCPDTRGALSIRCLWLLWPHFLWSQALVWMTGTAPPSLEAVSTAR